MILKKENDLIKKKKLTLEVKLERIAQFQNEAGIGFEETQIEQEDHNDKKIESKKIRNLKDEFEGKF